MKRRTIRSLPGAAFCASLLLALLTLAPDVHADANPTSTPTATGSKCENRTGGSRKFGLAGVGCDAATFGEDAFVEGLYGSLIFKETRDRGMELPRYMTVLNAVIRDAALYYIQNRNPDVSSEETAAWLHAVQALIHQESLWSHYRRAADGRLKTMQGETGHGHGLTQIDDRWHSVAIQEGAGWDLVENLVYGLEEFYSSWMRAAQASCVPSPSDWKQRSQAAYSIYNGGPVSVCRWTRQDHRWAQNDRGFLRKYNALAWRNLIHHENAPAPFDVACRIEGGTQCLKRSQLDVVPTPNDLRGRLVRLENGAVCFVEGRVLHCVRADRDRLCLQAKGARVDDVPVDLSTAALSEFEVVRHDRHQLCTQISAPAAPVGSHLRLGQDVHLRTSVGGGSLAVVEAGTVVEVLDFEIQDAARLKRYYKIHSQGQSGWIYGGDRADAAEWTESTTDIADSQMLPAVGAPIKIRSFNGINLRASPGGRWIGAVPTRAVLRVEDLHIQGEDHSVFYRVTSADGVTGWIYGGRLLPRPTIRAWAEMTVEDVL